MSRRALPDPEPADRWVFDQIGTEIGLGYSITREMLDNNLYRGMFAAEPAPAFMVAPEPPQSVQWSTIDDPAGCLDTPVMDAEQIRRVLALHHEAMSRDALTMIGTTNAAPPPQPMRLDLGAIRDLLLPGLGTYPRIDRQYPRVFGRGEPVHFPRLPRIDPETAAGARERATGLLKSLLTPDQWAEFEAWGSVTERIDGCEFKLRPGGMIEARKPRRLVGSVIERWCVAPEGDDWMPDEDKLIGQLLHLRAGPDKLRAQANIFR
jgi:hypothetical protein